MIDKSLVVISKEQENNFYSSLSSENTRVSLVPFSYSKEFFQKKNPDIVLLDCGHDNESGLGWLNEFKKEKKDVPVIFITSVKSHDTVMRAYKLGVRDYFIKPVSMSELNRVITDLHSLKCQSREKRKTLPCVPPKIDCKMTNIMTSDIPTKIACIVHYIEENISKPFNLANIASQANLSKFHFARIFKKLTGFSPLEFVIIMKMHKAKKLLMEKELPISVVAEEVGYLDLRNFNRCFKKHTGITPAAYRNSCFNNL